MLTGVIGRVVVSILAGSSGVWLHRCSEMQPWQHTGCAGGYRSACGGGISTRGVLPRVGSEHLQVWGDSRLRVLGLCRHARLAWRFGCPIWQPVFNGTVRYASLVKSVHPPHIAGISLNCLMEGRRRARDVGIRAQNWVSTRGVLCSRNGVQIQSFWNNNRSPASRSVCCRKCHLSLVVFARLLL